MNQVNEVSDELQAFSLFALEHATGSVVPDGGPLVPFAMTENSQGRQLLRFEGDLVAGQEAARSAVGQAVGLKLAAVAWDGYLTIEGRRTDAVFVDASDDSGGRGVMLAQRYESSGRLRKRTRELGDVCFVERRAPLFPVP